MSGRRCPVRNGQRTRGSRNIPGHQLANPRHILQSMRRSRGFSRTSPSRGLGNPSSSASASHRGWVNNPASASSSRVTASNRASASTLGTGNRRGRRRPPGPSGQPPVAQHSPTDRGLITNRVLIEVKRSPGRMDVDRRRKARRSRAAVPSWLRWWSPRWSPADSPAVSEPGGAPSRPPRNRRRPANRSKPANHRHQHPTPVSRPSPSRYCPAP